MYLSIIWYVLNSIFSQGTCNERLLWLY